MYYNKQKLKCLLQFASLRKYLKSDNKTLERHNDRSSHRYKMSEIK